MTADDLRAPLRESVIADPRARTKVTTHSEVTVADVTTCSVCDLAMHRH